MSETFSPVTDSVMPVVGEETAFIQLGSGALAGLFAETCTHSMDTVRARLQHQRGVGEYKGLIQTFGRILKAEGVRGLYGGFGSVLFFTVPAHAFYFFGYETTKQYLRPDLTMEDKPVWVHFTSGIVAELLGALMWTPQDVVKQRLQVLPAGKRPSTMSIVREITKEKGIFGMWKGLGAGVMTYGPFVGCYFVCYEQFKLLSKNLSGKEMEKDIPMPYILVSGGMAGAIAAGITCPLDVIKTRIQIETGPEYSTIRRATKAMLQEGYGVFWKGLAARINWIAPSCALTLAAYERCKGLLIKVSK